MLLFNIFFLNLFRKDRSKVIICSWAMYFLHCLHARLRMLTNSKRNGYLKRQKPCRWCISLTWRLWCLELIDWFNGSGSFNWFESSVVRIGKDFHKKTLNLFTKLSSQKFSSCKVCGFSQNFFSQNLVLLVEASLKCHVRVGRFGHNVTLYQIWKQGTNENSHFYGEPIFSSKT